MTNLAPDGLFVETRKSIKHGTQVEIQVAGTNEVPEMTVRAIVLRQRLTAARSSRLKQEGVGLRILQAPDEYYALVERELKASEPKDASPDPALKHLRVKLSERASSAYRIVAITSSSAEAARTEIEGELEPEWQVLDVLSS